MLRRRVATLTLLSACWPVCAPGRRPLLFALSCREFLFDPTDQQRFATCIYLFVGRLSSFFFKEHIWKILTSWPHQASQPTFNISFDSFFGLFNFLIIFCLSSLARVFVARFFHSFFSKNRLLAHCLSWPYMAHPLSSTAEITFFVSSRCLLFAFCSLIACTSFSFSLLLRRLYSKCSLCILFVLSSSIN